MADLIAIEENGQRVIGRLLSRSRRFIEVQLDARDAKLNMSVTVPLFAASQVSLLDDEGDRCAVAMLRRLHRQAEFVKEHRGSLKVLWNHVDELLFELAQTHPGADLIALGEARKTFRRQFTGGRLDRREYQMTLNSLRKLRSAYEAERDEAVAIFMGPWSFGLQLKQVLTLLDSAHREERST